MDGYWERRPVTNLRDRDERLEHRLTKLESGQLALQAQVANAEGEIVRRLDYSNSKMVDHFTADAEWQHIHDIDAARSRGFQKGQMATLAALITGGGIIAGFLVKLLEVLA